MEMSAPTLTCGCTIFVTISGKHHSLFFYSSPSVIFWNIPEHITLRPIAVA